MTCLYLSVAICVRELYYLSDYSVVIRLTYDVPFSNLTFLLILRLYAMYIELFNNEWCKYSATNILDRLWRSLSMFRPVTNTTRD